MKSWILSALGVGAVVAIILATTGRDAPPKRGGPAPLKPLTERDVRTYIQFVGARKTIMEPTAQNGGFRPKTKAEIVPAMRRVHARLELTESQSRTLVIRVGRVVRAIRWERTSSTSKKNLQNKREVWTSKTPHDEDEKRVIEAEIARIDRALLGPQASDADKELVLKFWNDIDKIATRNFGE